MNPSIASPGKNNRLPLRTKGNLLLTKAFLICGILSSLLYVAMNIFVPMLYEGYNSASQTVSELSAIGAPTRTLWVSLGVVYSLLMVAFGWGIWQSSARNRPLRILAGLIFSYGLVSLFWPLAPMHQREVLAAGGETLSDNLHIVFTFVTVLLMMLAIGFGSAAFGKQFRFYSIATIMIHLVFGYLTGLDAPRINANLPTPWAGAWERINIGVFVLWVIVLAIILLRRENVPGGENRTTT